MRICAFGDSFVNGTGDVDGLGWLGRLITRARRGGADVTLYNLGIRRDTSDDVAARWHEEATRRLPHGCTPRLVFSFGTNDCVAEGTTPRVPLERARTRSHAIFSRAAAMAPTIVIGPVPVLDDAATDARIHALAAAQAEICARAGVPFLAVHDVVAACAPWRREAAAGDGTHPGADGYAALAEHIWAWPHLRAWLDPSR